MPGRGTRLLRRYLREHVRIKQNVFHVIVRDIYGTRPMFIKANDYTHAMDKAKREGRKHPDIQVTIEFISCTDYERKEEKI